MFGPMKRHLCVVVVITVIASSYVLAAPPERVIIPRDLLNSKLLSVHVRKIAERMKYFAKALLTADEIDAVVAARDSLVEDYNLYDSPNYQDVYAKLISRLFDSVIKEGKGLDINDPLRELKLVNVAIVLCDISNKETAESYYAMIASNEDAMRFLGWKALRDLRGTGLDKAELQKLFAAAQNSLATEKNSNILAMVCQTLNFTTSETDKLPENYRQAVSKVSYDMIKADWPRIVAGLKTTQNPEDIFNVGVPVATLAGSAIMVGDKPTTEEAKKLTLVVTSLAVERFDKILIEKTADEKKLKFLEKQAETVTEATTSRTRRKKTTAPDSQKLAATPEQLKLKQRISQLDALEQACKILMVNCEFALNTLTGKEENYFASQMTVSGAQAAALKMALIDWKDIVEAK